MDGWRRDLATGGVSRRIERDPEQLRAQISNKMVGGATEAESRAVLERMNAKVIGNTSGYQTVVKWLESL